MGRDRLRGTVSTDLKGCIAEANTFLGKSNKTFGDVCEEQLKLSKHEKALLDGNYKIIVGKHKIPSFMVLQKEFTTKGGQMHFRTNDTKKEPKVKTEKKRKRQPKRGYKDLTPFGIVALDIKTLRDILK